MRSDKYITVLNLLPKQRTEPCDRGTSPNLSDSLVAKRTLSCSSSSFCSSTIISDFPCCAARKLKKRRHFTRTSENWSCESVTIHQRWPLERMCLNTQTYEELWSSESCHFNGWKSIRTGSPWKKQIIFVHFLFAYPSTHQNHACTCLPALTGCFNAVYEGLHLVITFRLVCVEVGPSADDAPTPVPELAVGLVLFLALISIWRESRADVGAAVAITLAPFSTGHAHKPGLSLSASETQELKEKWEASSEQSSKCKRASQFKPNQTRVSFTLRRRLAGLQL